MEIRDFQGFGWAIFIAVERGPFRSFLVGTYQEKGREYFRMYIEGGDFQELWSGCLGSGRSRF